MPEIVRGDGSAYASACSGALIDPQWIILAGHCVHDGDRNRISGEPHYPITATVGQATRSGSAGATVDVVHVAQHDAVDVAIGELAAPVADVAPIPIASAAPEPGEAVRLVGWGASDAGQTVLDRPDRMQTGEMIVSRVDTELTFIRASEPEAKTSACPWDSGAPYFTEGADGTVELVATVVDGPACPHGEEESAARADVLGPWIAEHTSTVS
ncbi:trypsin [Tamaricihabitans halophyticus]|uniref:Trypsin n=1 Tax=Tamaricihabitans halophyticus TaxID=1262583 RepID=A0A4V2SS24_9PSEU|nr:trypsin-like serine protease [Tamaricihabitans halophyticus]TCP45116.1 trypsin [Tamaricihabitans halophyticus]